MRDLEDRLAALEESTSTLRDTIALTASGLRRVQEEAIRSRRARDTAAYGDLVARLDPGPLTGGIRGHRGARVPAAPDIGRPLLSRLRDDPNVAGYAPGRTDPYQGTGNLLNDPTLHSIFGSVSAPTLTTSNQNVGGLWAARYVLNSGTAPATRRRIYRYADRGLENAWGSSGVALLDLAWGAAAFDLTVYLEPNGHFTSADGDFFPSFITAAVRAFLGGTPTNVTSVTGYIEIVDQSSGSDVLIAQSDPEDLLTLNTQGISTSRLQTAYESPIDTGDYLWRLRVDVVAPASAGSVAVRITEPLLALSEDGSAPAFTPAVGGWQPEQAWGWANTASETFLYLWLDGAEVFRMAGDATMEWYDPGGGGLETTLSRAAANILELEDGLFQVVRDAASNFGLATKVTGDSLARWGVQADGEMEWGTGGARDTRLRRTAAGELTLDNNAGGAATLVADTFIGDVIGNTNGTVVAASAQVDGTLSIAEQAAPATPSSGYGVWWVGTDGIARFKNDAGETFILGLSLYPITFVEDNVPAASTLDLQPSDIALALATPRIGAGGYSGHIVGASYRLSAAIAAGTLDVNISLAGVNVWTPFNLTSASPAAANAPQVINTDTTGGGQIGVNVVTNGAFSPATLEIVVVVLLALRLPS